MKKIILIIVYTLSLTVGNMVYAQTGEYTTLAPLPGTTKSCNETTCTADINSYLGGFLNLTITIGAVLAMIYIGLYGFQYAVSDSAPKKSEYKDKLSGAVKILEKEKIQDVSDVERVAREIHILKLIRHPHII